MRIVLDLTPEQYRAALSLTKSALHPLRVRQDPQFEPLRGYCDELKKAEEQSLCGECFERIIYAKGKCKACYRRLKSA